MATDPPPRALRRRSRRRARARAGEPGARPRAAQEQVRRARRPGGSPGEQAPSIGGLPSVMGDGGIPMLGAPGPVTTGETPSPPGGCGSVGAPGLTTARRLGSASANGGSSSSARASSSKPPSSSASRRCCATISDGSMDARSASRSGSGTWKRASPRSSTGTPASAARCTPSSTSKTSISSSAATRSASKPEPTMAPARSTRSTSWGSARKSRGWPGVPFPEARPLRSGPGARRPRRRGAGGC